MVAGMSWKTAKRSNALTETAQERERARTRRMIALEVREWAETNHERIRTGAKFDSATFVRDARELRKRCRVEGEAEGSMLIDALGARLRSFYRDGLHRPTDWDRGVLAMPRAARYPELLLLEEWAENPRSVRSAAVQTLRDASFLMPIASLRARERKRERDNGGGDAST